MNSLGKDKSFFSPVETGKVKIETARGWSKEATAPPSGRCAQPL